jgi:uncharacterized protein YecT (DUF1311 family)
MLILVILAPVRLQAQTQKDMNEDSCTTLKRSDAKLNQVYREVLKQHEKDLQFQEKFKAAQRAWLSFREAEMKAIFPSSDQRDYGSVRPLCECDALNALTQARIKQLQEWLDAPEGDVCAGTRRP